MKTTLEPEVADAILKRHTAVFGMTGSGKTSTAKLLIEKVADEGSRVCILDPIKSDWWGLTSSKSGKGPGLPFQILGGPHGHVPLHAGAGAAIGEVVATGKLPLSIIDMADFGPGGLQKFFNDFVPVLMRKMRGVLYLAIEEAHEFAPKEKSGAGGETMAIYHAKKLATAGRSKGIRLVVASQRVQALHNAVIGSCETLIVHRMTAPADQEPVTKWLKGTVKEREFRERIEYSMPELADGEGWICSGSAKILERVQFPRIHTFDNSATPEDDAHNLEVVTAKVDVEQLRELVGQAVQEAAANDPAVLQKWIRELEAKVAAKPEGASTEEVEEIERRGYERGRLVGFTEGRAAATAAREDLRRALHLHIDSAFDALHFPEPNTPPSPVARPAPQRATPAAVHRPDGLTRAPVKRPAPVRGAGNGTIAGGAPRNLLIALAQNPEGLRPRKLAILAEVQEGGSTWRGAFAKFRRESLVTEMGGVIAITREGLDALGSYAPLPTGHELRTQWREKIGGGETRRAIFDAIIDAYPASISAAEVARRANVEPGGSTWRGHMAHLRGLELVSGSAELRASEDLFS